MAAHRCRAFSEDRRRGLGAATLVFSLALCSGLSAAYAACEPPAARYEGKLFDAMAQIDAGMEATVLRSLRESGVSRMALFGRDKGRRSGDAAVLSLARGDPSVFV